MPRYNNPRRTWQYTNEFKIKAVQLSLIEGVQVKLVAETLDRHSFMLSRWRKEYRADQCTDNAHMESAFIQ
jgi:transposase